MGQEIPKESFDRLRMRVDDEERLTALRAYKILDTAPEPAYEQVVDLVHRVCQAAMTAVSFVDRDRQWFKARRGTTLTGTPRSVSFCSVAMQQMMPLIVENTRLDARFRDNPLVREMGVRFFAGYPLFSHEGHGLGSVCILDRKPRTLMTCQLEALERARNWVRADLDRRRSALEWKDGTSCRTPEECRQGEQAQALKKLLAEHAWSTMMEVAAAPILRGASR